MRRSSMHEQIALFEERIEATTTSSNKSNYRVTQKLLKDAWYSIREVRQTFLF